VFSCTGAVLMATQVEVASNYGLPAQYRSVRKSQKSLSKTTKQISYNNVRLPLMNIADPIPSHDGRRHSCAPDTKILVRVHIPMQKITYEMKVHPDMPMGCPDVTPRGSRFRDIWGLDATIRGCEAMKSSCTRRRWRKKRDANQLAHPSNLKALIQKVTGVKIDDQMLILHGVALNAKPMPERTLRSYGIFHGTVITLRERRKMEQTQSLPTIERMERNKFLPVLSTAKLKKATSEKKMREIAHRNRQIRLQMKRSRKILATKELVDDDNDPEIWPSPTWMHSDYPNLFGKEEAIAHRCATVFLPKVGEFGKSIAVDKIRRKFGQYKEFDKKRQKLSSPDFLQKMFRVMTDHSFSIKELFQAWKSAVYDDKRRREEVAHAEQKQGIYER